MRRSLGPNGRELEEGRNEAMCKEAERLTDPRCPPTLLKQIVRNSYFISAEMLLSFSSPQTSKMYHTDIPAGQHCSTILHAAEACMMLRPIPYLLISLLSNCPFRVMPILGPIGYGTLQTRSAWLTLKRAARVIFYVKTRIIC